MARDHGVAVGRSHDVSEIYSRDIEVHCAGPVTSALLQAMERGVRVRSWTLAEGGVVVLRVPGRCRPQVTQWYLESAAGWRRPGDCLAYMLVQD